MGKGIIKSGGADGFYNVELTFERESIGETISLIDIRIELLTSVIDIMNEGSGKELVKLERNSYIKKKEYLQNNMPEDPTVSAWCADLTEDITGNVGTIEVPGERGIVQIQPGYENNSTYDSIRDGQLQPSIAGTPASTFYNLAMLPGWQKWKPTYRYGVISNIDTDANTCNVKLDEIKSSQQNLDINQELNLTGIDVSYMSCDSSAFEDGDNVLVKFVGQTWTGAQVVGFKNNPKDCEFYIDITINSKVPEYTKTLKIVDNEDEEYIASSSEEEPGKVGPFLGVVWPAKIYLYYTGGAGVVFSYYQEIAPAEPEDPPISYLVAREDYDFCCREEWGRSKLNCYSFSSYTPDGNEEFALPVAIVEYLLHSTFVSKPTSVLSFTTKVLGQLKIKDSIHDFSGCSGCDLVAVNKAWGDDVDSIIYQPCVSGFFPGSCCQVETLEFCVSGSGCQGFYIPSFESCDINDMGIMTDMDGLNEVFSGATIQLKYEGVSANCEDAEQNQICYVEDHTEFGTRIWEWKMLPTPEDRI